MASLKNDIVPYLFNSTGQFIVGGLSSVNLNLQQLWYVLQVELDNYQRYVPLKKHFNVTGYGYFRYDFSQDPHNVGYSATNPTTISHSESLLASIQQSFQLTVPNHPVALSSVIVKFDGTAVAIDSNDGTGNLIFDAPYNSYWSGQIDYLTGIATFTANNLVSDETINVEIDASYITFGKPPHKIISFMPVGTMQVISVLAYWMSPMVRNIYSPDRLLEPRMFLYKYVDDVIYYSESGQFDCIASYDYQVIETTDDSGNLLDVEIVGIEENTNYYVFLQLCAARFMQMLGRSRRAFLYNDLGITTDSEKLVSEGETMYEKAIQQLDDRSEWWLAVRP